MSFKKEPENKQPDYSDVILIFIGLLGLALFYGEPSLHEAFIAYLMRGNCS